MSNNIEPGLDIVESKTRSLSSVGVNPMQMVVDRLNILWCSVPLSSPHGKQLLAAIVGDTTIKDDDRLAGEVDIIAAIVCGPRGSDPETGEVYTSPVTTFLLSSMETLAWASPGVADCLAVTCMDRPPGLWSPPIRVRFVGVKCSNGHRRMTLREIPVDPPTPERKGGKRG